MQVQLSEVERSRFREAREAAGLTLRELSDLTGYGISTLSTVENGPDHPSQRLYAKVLEVLNVDVNWFRTGTGAMFCGALKLSLTFATPPFLLPKLRARAEELRDLAAEYNRLAAKMEKEIEFGEWCLSQMDTSEVQKQSLTNVTAEGYKESVQAVIPKLIERLIKATKERGKKAELARWLGVPMPRITEWLSGKREPGGETTLRLLLWVEQQERKQ